MLRHNKLYSLVCLSTYLLVSTNCAPWIIYTGGEVLFGVIHNEYACKGGNCGCTSAFKCLTDCCCEKVSVEGKLVAACKRPVNLSCCSDKIDSCCTDGAVSQDDKELENNGEAIIYGSKCSPDLSQNLTKGITFHILLLSGSEQAYFKLISSLIWNSASDNYLFELNSKISKIPIP